MVKELAPFWPAARAVPRRVNEDQMTGVSTNAVEVQLLSTSLSGSMSDDLSLAKTTPSQAWSSYATDPSAQRLR